MSYRDIRRNPSSDPVKDREFLDSTQVKHLREGVLFDIELMERSPRSFRRGQGFKPGNEAVWTSTLKPASEISPFEDWDEDDPQGMTTSWAQDADYFYAYGEDAALFSIEPWARVFHIRNVPDQQRLMAKYGYTNRNAPDEGGIDWDQMLIDGWDGVHLALDYFKNWRDDGWRPREWLGMTFWNLWLDGWDAESTAWLNPSALIFKGLARVDSEGMVTVRNPSRLSRLYSRAWRNVKKE